MALKKVKGSIDRIFDKNLQDLVRGIRNHKDDEAHFISTCIDEIKQELKQENVQGKANATKKLIYLQMLGYDISWAAFNVIEVMSSAKFTHKRIGYMVASQSFHSDTDVLMLATNLIKKDLTSQNVFDVGVALAGLSCFITPDLARDLSNDLMSLMSSTKPYIRKRAVLISYKIFLNYPEALRPAFPRLREKLEDPDPGVQSAAVNVICELARKNPKNYLSLAPVFFKLMTSSTTTNNWVLIKVIKLFGALTPLEPRLGKKLIEPLTNLIHNTSAMSLLYECINTVIQGMQDHSASIQGFPTVMKLCVQKLRILIEDSDQNLKYLGLLALSRILKSHPKAVQAHKDLILQCLDDKDESIRLRALDLLFGMVSKKNLMEIIQKLLIHVQKAETIQYRDELISKIIEICSRNNFYFITNFEWYLTVLVELTRVDGVSRHGSLVSSQILDVAIRVKTIRPFAANKVAVILQNSHALSIQLRRNGMIEVLYAAAYICGEFGQNIDNLEAVLFSMLDPHVLHHPTHIQHIFIQNMVKLFAVLLSQVEEDGGCDAALQLTKTVQDKLVIFVNSSNLEVQERASCASALLKQLEKLLLKSTPVAVQFAALFKGELNPVAPKAQKRVPLPEGLDLDVWINDPPSSASESDEEEVGRGGSENSTAFYPTTKKESRPELSPEEMKKRKAARKAEQASNPNYLTAANKKGDDLESEYQKPDAEVDELSSVDSVPLRVPGLSTSDQYIKLEQQRRRAAKSSMEKQQQKKSGGKSGKKGKKSKLAAAAEHQAMLKKEEELFSVHKVEIMDYEMPEGALKSDSDDESKSDIYKALDIDLEPPPQVQLPTKKSPKKKSNKQQNELTPDSIEKQGKSKKKSSSKKSGLKKSKKSKDAVAAAAAVIEEEMNGDQHHEDVPEIKFEESISNMSINELADDTTAPTRVVEGEKKEKKSKKSKSKKGDKKEKKSKKKSKRAEKITTMEEEEEEEEEEVAVVVKHNYQVLVEDKQIRVQFETRASSNEGKLISLYCIFTNLTDQIISDISFNLTDTLNTKLVRTGSSSSDTGCRLPFSLYPYTSNESSFLLTASSVVMPQRLRGHVTTDHQLDFKLYLPCSSYLISTSCSSDAFAKLLASDQLTDKSSARLISPNLQFTDVLQLISKLNFTVVEQIGENASLFSRSIQGHHLCLLIKKVTNGISVEGKGDNQSILSNVIDEIKLLVPSQ